ncbi:MAG: histidine kinase dimerization/phosphoacceptor domain -containing protein [Spirochaetota bacterium]
MDSIRSDEWFRALFEDLAEGIALLAEGEILLANRSFAHILGVEQSELSGKRLESFFPQSQVNTINRVIDEAVVNVQKTCTLRYRKPGGGKDKINYEIDVSVKPVLIENKKVIQLIVRDISNMTAEKEIRQIKALEHSIRASDALKHSIMDSPPDINIWSVDRKYRYTFFNNSHKKGMKQVWNADIELGKNLLSYLTDDEYREATKKRYDRALSGENFTTITRLKDVNNNTVYFDNYSSPIYSENGEIAGLTVFAVNITEKKRIEEKIQASLQEKEALLKEVHHRVKNNLQIISSMINLQQDKIKDPYDRQVFLESRNRIHSLAFIHEILYKSEDLYSINMKQYFETLVSAILNSYDISPKRINVVFNIEEINLSIDTAIPIGIISNELITNSIKYAFPDNRAGRITINFTIFDNKDILFFVADNGVGVTQDFMYQNSKSLGFQIVEVLTQQLQGCFSMVPLKHGIECRIVFPYSG